MPVPSAQQREFIERIGLFFEQVGGQRTAGRIFGWLMVCEPAHQSITEIAEALQLSKASISGIARQLEAGQLIERVPVPGSRQHYYRHRAGGWAQIMRGRVARLGSGMEAAEFGLSIIGEDQAEQRERVEELRDFLTFVELEYGEEHVRRWEDYRKRARDRRAEDRHV